MLHYSLSPEVEAFSTNRQDALDFEVLLPQHQAHSDKVRLVPAETDDITGVDALITDVEGLRIGVKTADCVPILLFDPVHRAVGAVHSGWRGTVKNILSATIMRMRQEFGTDPSDMKAVIGPCIHLSAFEVGDEVYEAFAVALGKDIALYAERQAKWHINLPGVCRYQLLALGLRDENVEVRPECTFAQADKFFSARRLGKEFDRQRIYNCIALKAEAYSSSCGSSQISL